MLPPNDPHDARHADARMDNLVLLCRRHHVDQVVERTRRPVDLEGAVRPVPGRDGGDARRVVPPVLQPPQTPQQDVARRAPAHVPHDAAHGDRG